MFRCHISVKNKRPLTLVFHDKSVSLEEVCGTEQNTLYVQLDKQVQSSLNTQNKLRPLTQSHYSELNVLMQHLYRFKTFLKMPLTHHISDEMFSLVFCVDRNNTTAPKIRWWQILTKYLYFVLCRVDGPERPTSAHVTPKVTSLTTQMHNATRTKRIRWGSETERLKKNNEVIQ